jgi:sulfite exporter TauE/SafE
MNLWVIFVTGLTVGGLTCLAVQGGLLASVIAGRPTILPTLAFLTAKLIAYTILGFILGAFGKVIGINQTTQTIMQLIAGLYMIAIALNLLNIHPIFRYAVIQPPRFLTKKVRNQSKSKALFAPALLGAMTIFIPCGTTLAMEALAITSVNPLSGATIMAVFVLGTTPLFFGVGWITSILGDTFRERFLKIAAVAVLYLGIISINGALTALGSPLSFQSVLGTAQQRSSVTSQDVEIIITSRGYTPNYITVKNGSPVTIRLTSKDAYSCASAFRIPSLGISRNLQANETQILSFTPTKIGKIPFTCSMGMYQGIIEVI